MKKHVFIVEKTDTGYAAYSEDFDNTPVGTTGVNLKELKVNVVDALNSHSELYNLPELSINDVQIKLDLPQFFSFYKVINASDLGERIGMNKTLISQYVNGHKKPSEKQVAKILDGVRQLGKELSSLELV